MKNITLILVELYVQERSVGADAWRRTGILTFDGNKAGRNEKVKGGQQVSDIASRDIDKGYILENTRTPTGRKINYLMGQWYNFV